jgi:BirA family biotin operon repressor/biotin-[acetyl-CoA-carboxylase] ligase
MPTTAPIARSAASLARELHGTDLDWEAVASTASTNADLVARARVQAPPRPIVLAADEQTAGRGRFGRTWHATPGGALLFSVAVPWKRAPADSAAVALACGVAVAQCLEEAGVRAALKWPNDVLLDGRKLAGILTELTEDRSGAHALVIGLGLNLFVDHAQRRAIEQPVAELAEALGREPVVHGRERWLARLALALIGAAARFEVHGFGSVCADFNRYCAFLGQTVTLHAGGQQVHRGIVLGVDEQGRLLLKCGERVLTMISGEMSLRAQLPDRIHLGEPP